MVRQVIARMLAAVLVGALTLPNAAAASQPLSPRSIIKRLNTERARQGLPSTVQEVPLWSDRCASHNHWMSLNDVAQHDEPPGSEGYSEAGDWAGSNSVLAQGTTWRGGNPFKDAPLHLMQLFNPDLRRAGASDAYNSTLHHHLAGHDRAPRPARVDDAPRQRPGRDLAARLGGAVHAAGARRDRRRHAHRALPLRLDGRVHRAGRRLPDRPGRDDRGHPRDRQRHRRRHRRRGQRLAAPVSPLKRAHQVRRHGHADRRVRRLQLQLGFTTSG